MKENGNYYYYITDRLGNVRYVLDSSGSVVNSYSYTPFGQIHSSSGSLSQPYQFVGGEFYWREEDIGLHLLGQRWYDAEVGRFISRDNIFNLNLYLYANNNSVNWKDPRGLRVEYCIKPHAEGFPYVDHVFIRVNNDQGCGFWPGGFPFGGRGQVEIPDLYNDNKSIPCAEILPPPNVPSMEWDKCFADFCKEMQQNPPIYVYGYHDCIWFADKAVKECEKKTKCKK